MGLEFKDKVDLVTGATRGIGCGARRPRQRSGLRPPGARNHRRLRPPASFATGSSSKLDGGASGVF